MKNKMFFSRFVNMPGEVEGAVGDVSWVFSAPPPPPHLKKKIFVQLQKISQWELTFLFRFPFRFPNDHIIFACDEWEEPPHLDEDLFSPLFLRHTVFNNFQH